VAEDRIAAFPESPCVGICRIDENGYCEGCLRTMNEISRWPLMSTHERAAVFELLDVRAKTLDPA
jgi:hypothetical protein